MKVAIVHDWLIGGGAERVVLELHRMFPGAPIYTSYATDEWRQKLDNKVITSYLQNFPRLRKSLPFLRARWFSNLKLDSFDLVISSSGAEAKGIRVPKNTKHINYCHAPTHYYWSRHQEYLEHPGWGVFDPFGRLGLKLLVTPMRKWDLQAAKQPDVMIANSSFTQSEIKKYYDRDSVVIHPPVDVDKFAPNLPTRRQGFVVTGRHTPYKRIDLAVLACSKLNLPLIVIGKGPDYENLRKQAGPSVIFKGWVNDEEVVASLQSAQAYIFPALDDFGISAVEALAAGTPVIAYEAGGALDYVEEAKTGLFFKAQTVESLCETLQKFDTKQFNAKEISESAQKFRPEIFRQKISEEIRKMDL